MIFSKITYRPPTQLHTGFPVTQAVLDGSQEGYIYRSGDDHFVLHKFGFSSLVSTKTNYASFIEFIRVENQLPQYFHIYDAPAGLVDSISERTDMFNVKIRKRIQFAYYSHPISEIKLPRFHARPMNRVDLGAVGAFELSLADRFWNGVDDLLDNAITILVVETTNDMPVGICYAAAVADGRAEIDVFTLPEYRGKGIAKLAVSAFVNACIRKGIVANWDCFTENIGSIRTALSLNFQSRKEYTFLSIYKHNKTI